MNKRIALASLILTLLLAACGNENAKGIGLSDEGETLHKCPGLEFYVADLDDCPDDEEDNSTSTPRVVERDPTAIATTKPRATSEPTSTVEVMPVEEITPYRESVTVEAWDADGAVIDLGEPGFYLVTVTGSYNTGMPHDRSIVLFMESSDPIKSCDQWNNPCYRAQLGDWNSGNPPVPTRMEFGYTKVRVMTADDLTSYGYDNHGSVTVTFERVP